MTILVTGGSGLLGTSLKEIMPNAIYVNSKDYDLKNKNQCEQMILNIRPDVVIHLAAKVGGVLDNMNFLYDYFTENILINTNIINSCLTYKVHRFIGILSTCIYPDIANSYPLFENKLHDSPPPQSNFGYAYAKRMMAVQIDACNKQYKTKYSYLIPSNLYGFNDCYDEKKGHFVASLIKKIHEAKKNKKNSITLFGTGKPIRQFIFAEDVAKIITYITNNNINENINICPDESLSIHEIAKIALSACEAEHLNIEYDNSMPDGQIRKDASNKKLKILIPNVQFTPLYEGIKRTYENYKLFN